MAGGWNLQQVKVFFFFAGALLFGGDVISAENGGNHVIFVAMDQPLTGFGDRKLHGVGFAVMVGHFLGSAAEEFDNCVVTEVKLISTFEVDDSSERDDASHAGFVRGQTKCELASGGVPHHQKPMRIEVVLVGVLQEEVKTQQERLGAGMVGQLNVSRAEVTLANEQPELIDAQTQLQNSYLRLSELFGMDLKSKSVHAQFEVTGQLQYQARHPDLNECLGRADVDRPEIKARQIDVEIEEAQEKLDRSTLRPWVDVSSGYELYNERDPLIGHEFNHGYVLGLNAHWHIFDGFATKGRVIATRARRDAAAQTLDATRRSVASEVRSAFLDLEQSDRVLEAETKNVQTADESLEIAKGTLSAGLGTQLDVLQAASDVTRTRTTRLSAIYLHNVALARLARACAVEPDALEFKPKNTGETKEANQIVDLAMPPAQLTER